MRLLIILSIILVSVACTATPTECNYQIECYEIYTSEDGDKDTLILTSAIGHVFYADTSEYAPISYESALKGEISNKTSTSTVSASITAPAESLTGVITLGEVVESRATFVICDTKNQIYAYRQFQVGEGIPIIETYIGFYPSLFDNNPDTTFTSSEWIFDK